MSAPGTARGDLALYDGRIPLGFIRPNGVLFEAYDLDGLWMGTFETQREATAALSPANGGAP